ncbi:MAG TPA: hypothetical protein VE082_04080 [Desulfobaccales bacterium]|nr:hypothetical protein [Desulfobaccales bacterium]
MGVRDFSPTPDSEMAIRAAKNPVGPEPRRLFAEASLDEYRIVGQT